ncbi:MAG: hypothetical protein N3A54_01215 [Patescibacteria group bacterium]|nr:hypothetical protein [Patescibacteria group bacterium]
MTKSDCFDIISDISFRLNRFSVKVPGKLYNFRCPFCGDSKKNPYKARGYFFEIPDKNTMGYKCHNCGVAYTFLGFLKRFDEELYRSVVIKKYDENRSDPKPEEPSVVITKDPLIEKSAGIPFSHLNNAKALSMKSLPDYHAAKIFCQKRKLPLEELQYLFFAEKFFDFVKYVKPDYERTLKNDPRIIIPFMDRDRQVHWVQGRGIVLGKDDVKYITVPINQSFPKIYGLHKNPEKFDAIFVLEGPFDSMFFQNAVAVAGSDLKAAINYFPNKNLVFVYDNEPKNKEICKKMKRIIKEGHKICIWPKELLKYGKDVNDLIVNGIPPQEICLIIEKNTFSGFEAEIQFSLWNK